MSDFPTSLPTFTNLDGAQTLAANNHAARHNKVHDEIAAVAAKVGINSSADTSSLDYKATQAASHASNSSNPHSVTKTQVGLSNVDNTSDTTKLAATLLAVYPVGAIYISVSSTNPGTLFGGTWVAFATGRTLVGIDSGQTEFDTVEETGGAKTHTLTTAEMPSHTHTQDAHTHTQDAHGHNISTYTGAAGGFPTAGITNAGTLITRATSSTTATNQNTTATNQNTGGGGAHNNLQPYVVVWMFKRTA